MSFECRADPRCQRGLTFLYRYHKDLDAERLFAALGLTLHRGEQRWGERLVHIGSLPKRFELQIGVRHGETRFMHRFSASDTQRQADKLRFETALAQVLT